MFKTDLSRTGRIAFSFIVAVACLLARSGSAQDFDDLSSQFDSEGIFDPTPGIFIGNADGSNMKRLTPASDSNPTGAMAWSPDGKSLVYSSWSYQNTLESKLFVVAVEGGSPRLLGNGGWPSFSPRGKRIAFSQLGKDAGVWVMGSDGPDEELVRIDEQGMCPKWSPNGAKLAYVQLREGKLSNIVVLDLIEGQRKLLFDPESTPYPQMTSAFAWSPDGKRVAFLASRADQTSDLGFVDVRGAEYGLTTRAITLKLRLAGQQSGSLAWSPDGTKLLTNSYDGLTVRHQLMSLDPASNEEFQILPLQNRGRSNLNAVYSPDGKQLAISTITNSMVTSPAYARTIRGRKNQE